MRWTARTCLADVIIDRSRNEKARRINKTGRAWRGGDVAGLVVFQNSVFDLKRGNVWSKLDSLKREPG